jgi:hypothetical protein
MLQLLTRQLLTPRVGAPNPHLTGESLSPAPAN